MHILLIHQAFASLDEPGGTRHHELARLLCSQGHRVTIIASAVSYLTGDKKNQGNRRTTDDSGVVIIRSSTLSSLHRSFIWRIISFLSFMISSTINGLWVRDVDVVWGTTPPIFQAFSAWLIARLKGAPLLLEVRDLWPAFAVAVGVLKNKTVIRMSEWLESFLYRHADHVLVNSPGFVDHVKGRGSSKVTVIPNGADPDMFNPENDGLAFRQKHGLLDKFVVLYAGAHGMSNDLGVLLESADLLKSEPSVQFVLIGDGKEKINLQTDAANRNLDNVLFVPPIPKFEIPAALAASNACLAILKPIEMYKTTFPNKVFDYMAAGRPVILSIDGVIREVIEEAQAGVFVQPGNPIHLTEVIKDLAANPEKCHKMGLNGRIHIITRFSRKDMANQLTALLQTLRRRNA